MYLKYTWNANTPIKRQRVTEQIGNEVQLQVIYQRCTLYVKIQMNSNKMDG